MQTRNTNRQPTPRAGFTLIEVLVTITIIAILAALAFRGIRAALEKGNRTRQVHELATLSQALEAFRSKYGIYPPSRIRLRENTEYDLTTADGDPIDEFDEHSVRYLRRIWPNIILPNPAALTPHERYRSFALWCKDSPTKSEYVDSDNDGQFDANEGTLEAEGRTYELEGDECLVFFLGGVAELIYDSSVVYDPNDPVLRSQTKAIVLHGFSSRPTNPGGTPRNDIPQTMSRVDPLFEFDARRLYVRAGLEHVAPPVADSGDADDVKRQDFLGAATGTVWTARPTKLPSYRPTISDITNPRPVAFFSSYEGQGYRPGDVNIPETDSVRPSYSPSDPPSEALWDRYKYQLLWPRLITAERTTFNPTGTAIAPTRAFPPYPYTETVPNPAAIPTSPGAVVRFYKRDGYQLIVTGPDNLYGPGGQLPRDPDLFMSDLRPTGASYDNLSSVTGSQSVGEFNDSRQ